jgi:hypothetical protein
MEYLIYTLTLVAYVAIGVFACLKGDLGLRLGGGWLLFGQLTSVAVDLSGHVSATLWLSVDSITAIGFLILAVYTASLWSGLCMMATAGVAALQAYYIINERAPDILYSHVNNAMMLVVGVSMFVAVCVTLQRRRPRRVAFASAQVAA